MDHNVRLSSTDLHIDVPPDLPLSPWTFSQGVRNRSSIPESFRKAHIVLIVKYVLALSVRELVIRYFFKVFPS